MLIFRIFVAVLSAYALMIIFLYLMQDKLLFPAGQQSFDDCASMKSLGALPKRLGNIRYYFKDTLEAKANFIFFHGNGGVACERSYFISSLSEIPLKMTFLEYPGYAGDKTAPSEKLILQQALELVSYLKKQNPKLPIILYGESLGTAVATYIASERPVEAIVLQSPFTSISSVAQNHYPFIPIKYIIRNQFLADKWAQKINIPALIFMSKDDAVIPPKITEKQILNFAPTSKVIRFENTDHNGMDDYHPKVFWGSIKEYIKDQLKLS